jgi:hypothetical protein
MQPPGDQSVLAALFEAQGALEGLLHNGCTCPEDALVAGRALLAFADYEDVAFCGVAALLDPAARQEFVTEHQQIAEDLTLLDWLLGATPESPDVDVLTASLLRRMRQHVARDGRLLTTVTRLSPARDRVVRRPR